MIEVVLLGTGNVATHLFRAFSASEGIRVKQVYNHSARSLKTFEREISTTTSLSSLVDADLYLLALKDDAICDTAKKLQERKALIAHTSGSVPLDALAFDRSGVFYPLQTFSKEKEVDYTSIPFCLEARKPSDLILLKKLALAVSNKAFEIDSHQRKKLHLSAVFVCNFVNHLYTIGEKICKENEIPFEILHPLINETAKKIESASPAEVQTGPAIRGDQSTINAHLELLNSTENTELYQLFTKAIQTFHGKKL